MNNIALHTEAGNIQEQIDDLKREKESLEDGISDVITKKHNTMDEIERIVSEKQYKERIVDYRKLDMKISDLECKDREAKLSKFRLLDMSKNIGGQRLTAETLTKPIVNTCLQVIIVVNIHVLVFVLPNNENSTATSKRRERVWLNTHHF